MRAVGVGGVEEGEPAIVAGAQQACESALARLIRGTSESDGAGSHREAAGTNSGLAKDDRVDCLDAMRRLRFEQIAHHARSETGGTEPGGSVGDEFPSIHGTSMYVRILDRKEQARFGRRWRD